MEKYGSHSILGINGVYIGNLVLPGALQHFVAVDGAPSLPPPENTASKPLADWKEVRSRFSSDGKVMSHELI